MTDIFLEHYGIKGMRWGVRKAEKNTTPLSKQEKREAKAQKFDKKAEVFSTKIRDLEVSTPRTSWGKQQKITDLTNLNLKKQAALDAAQAKRDGKLTRRQKQVIYGGAAAVALLAAYGAYTAVQTGQAHALSVKGKAFLNGTTGSLFKTNAKLAKPDMDVDELMGSVVKDVNPGYGRLGSKVNCRRCTYAYEMRRRGYDVAATRTTNGRGQDISGHMNALNPGKSKIRSGKLGILSEIAEEHAKKGLGLADKTPVTTTIKNEVGGFGKTRIKASAGKHVSPGDLFKALQSQPDRARGELGVLWSGFPAGGHSMAYEIVKGKPVILDTQSGKAFKSSMELSNFLNEKGLKMSQAGFTRLDNADLNEDFLLRWLKNA